MAKNDDTRPSSRTHDTRSHAGSSTRTSQHGTDAIRDRRRDRVVSTVKERPYAAAALATVAAGAAAFFLTRSKSDKPLMNWGQESEGDRLKGAGAFKQSGKQQGSTTSDRSLETATASPSSSAGTGAGTGANSPSAVQAASLSASGSTTNASATGGTGASGSSDNRNTGTTNTAGAGISGGSKASGGGKAGDTGLDATSKTETKAGAISYGA